MVSDANFLDAGQIHHVELVGAALHAARFDVIFEVLGHAGDQELVSRAARFRGHLGLLPLRGAGVFGEESHLGRGKAGEVRGDQLVAAFADRAVARIHQDGIERLGGALGQSRPQERRAVAQEARSGPQPDQRQRGGHGGGGEAVDPRALGHVPGLGLLGHTQGVVGQQREERIAGIVFDALREGQQALFELRIARLRAPRGVAAVETDYGYDERRRDGERQAKEQEDARTDDAAIREGELVDDQHRHDGERQRHAGSHRDAARQCDQSEPPFDGSQVLAQAIQRFHTAASLSTDRC